MSQSFVSGLIGFRTGVLTGCFCIVGIAGFSPNIAYAGLGESETTLQNHAGFYGKFPTHSKEQNSSYTVHQMVRSNTVRSRVNVVQNVREFINKDGKVFAVTWVGQTPPDLNEIMGIHLEEFKRIAHTNIVKGHAGRRTGTITGSNFVIHRSSVGGRHTGTAYIPSLIPQGVAIEEVK